MNKITSKAGMPVLGQLLSFIDRPCFDFKVAETKSDRYVKTLKTWDLMATMLFAVIQRVDGLRELCSGMAAYEDSLKHLGMKQAPKRSTISDANAMRSVEVFEHTHSRLYRRFASLLSDSRLSKNDKWLKSLLLVDSTTITLFKSFMKGCGRPTLNGKRKGGLKVHAGMWLTDRTASFIRITNAATNDKKFMPRFKDMVRGTILVFDKAYVHYELFCHWSSTGVGFISRLNKNSRYEVIRDDNVGRKNSRAGVVKDQTIILGRTSNKHKVKVRLITFVDSVTGRELLFVSNKLTMASRNIAEAYRQRWQIEVLFKRLKQNLKTTEFLGDNENAVSIQIWCVLIADLLIAIQRGMTARLSQAYSTSVGLIRMHVMRYVKVIQLLRNPDDPQTYREYLPIDFGLFTATPP